MPQNSKTGRPHFIKNYLEIQNEKGFSYPRSQERMGLSSPIGKATGLTRIGVHLQILQPGERSSWPHAESSEEEFVYVVDGRPSVWIDGDVFELSPGDAVGFPSGTGISHCFLNDSEFEAKILVVGEANKDENKIYYPLHPDRIKDCEKYWWHDIPKKELGKHDGKPAKLRSRESVD